MTILKMLLKVLIHFGMVGTEEKGIMAKDIEEFELKATPDSDNKLYALYGRTTNNIWVRIAISFGFFFLVRQLKGMIETGVEDPFSDI